jgi:biopolymer transport protein ExbB/TolQ
MARSAQSKPRIVARTAHVWILMGLAGLFPVALAIVDPALMFERGWEQYVGTGLYFVALSIMVRETLRARRDDRAFLDAKRWLDEPSSMDAQDDRPLARRLRQLVADPRGDHLLDRLGEAAGLDQSQASARFTLTRYILYLLPVIGFIGTVEGISKALVNISKVLPLVKNLDGFLSNLTSVTGALQIAFDSTLLALFLSAWLALVQTLVQRLAEDHLTRVDRFVLDEALPRHATAAALSPDGSEFEDRVVGALDRLELTLGALISHLPKSLGEEVTELSSAVERLAPAAVALERSATSLSSVDATISAIPDQARKAVAALGRIESALEAGPDFSDTLEPMRRGIDRVAVGVESMAERWSEAMERSNRATQDQLARTLSGLKEALELLNVSMEQSNALYRSIVKRLVSPALSDREDRAA